MIRTIKGKIAKKEGKIMNKEIKILTYQVKGSWFPVSYYNGNSDTNTINGNEKIEFESAEPNSVVVNYGDGNTTVKQFELVGGVYKVGYNLGNETLPWVISQHTFQDNNAGLRNITFEFEKPLELDSIFFNFVRINGSLPTETTAFENIESLKYQFCRSIEAIPDSFPKKLKNYTLSRSLTSKKTSLPDSFFKSKLESVIINSSYDFSDLISSNFFKINQLKNTLLTLYAQDCNFSELPESIRECTLLIVLNLYGNEFKQIPKQTESLINIGNLKLGNAAGFALTNTGLPNWQNLNNLQQLSIDFEENLNLNEIPLKWVGLSSLSVINDFERFIRSDARFNEFIPQFYQLVIDNAFIDPSSQEAIATGYPNQFRQITWGHSSLSVDSTIEPPPNFTQGVFNGQAQTNGQRVYELGANYGHLIN